jgi:hypothetical protein
MMTAVDRKLYPTWRTAEDLGLETKVAVRELLLVGGPAAGGYVLMPEQGRGEFVVHCLPRAINEYQDVDGQWRYHIVSGGGTTDPTTGEPLGSMVYEVRDDSGNAHYVRHGHNPTSEDADADLDQAQPYLNNAARITEENVTESDA